MFVKLKYFNEFVPVVVATMFDLFGKCLYNNNVSFFKNHFNLDVL